MPPNGAFSENLMVSCGFHQGPIRRPSAITEGNRMVFRCIGPIWHVRNARWVFRAQIFLTCPWPFRTGGVGRLRFGRATSSLRARWLHFARWRSVGRSRLHLMFTSLWLRRSSHPLQELWLCCVECRSQKGCRSKSSSV